MQLVDFTFPNIWCCLLLQAHLKAYSITQWKSGLWVADFVHPDPSRYSTLQLWKWLNSTLQVFQIQLSWFGHWPMWKEHRAPKCHSWGGKKSLLSQNSSVRIKPAKEEWLKVPKARSFHVSVDQACWFPSKQPSKSEESHKVAWKMNHKYKNSIYNRCKWSEICHYDLEIKKVPLTLERSGLNKLQAWERRGPFCFPWARWARTKHDLFQS